MGTAKPETKKRWKRAHPESVRAQRRRYYEKKKRSGLCVDCGQPAQENIRCSVHAAKRREKKRDWQRKKRAERWEAGLCIDCGAEVETPPDYDKPPYCDKHRAQRVAITERHARPWRAD